MKNTAKCGVFLCLFYLFSFRKEDFYDENPLQINLQNLWEIYRTFVLNEKMPTGF